MKKPIGIVTDSHSGISQEEAGRLGIFVLPMPFYINGECTYEGVSLTREEFFKKQEAGVDVSTSQPAPAAVMEIWNKALLEYDKVLYMPLSSGLSGSCATTAAMAMDDKYEGRVLVVDHGQVSAPLHQMILDTMELIGKGYSAEKIKEILENAGQRMTIFIALQTLEYLKKGGRVTPAAAALGTVFNIKPVLRLETGKMDSFRKCHGFLKARKTMLEAMRNELETRFKDAYEAGAVNLQAATSTSPEETEGWKKEIEEAFPGMQVLCDPLSLGLCCHIGPGALGIGCSVKPDYGISNCEDVEPLTENE